ncbi:protein Skeletor, isoforms B/C-like [Branchiostoma floridae x Branchiostoma japonicum]
MHCHLVESRTQISAIVLVVAFLTGNSLAQTQYYGQLIGSFPTPAGPGGVAGTVYAVDADRVQIVGFSFDGSVSDVQFRAGSTDSPDGGAGVVVPDEQGRATPLGVYDNRRIVLTLPTGTTLDSVTWIAVWGQNTGNIGHVAIPDGLVIPRPRNIGEFSRRQHQVRSGNVNITDAKTFHIPNLHYDGFGPDAFFWAGTTDRPSSRGFKVPDHRGSFDRRLPRYTGQTIDITLPGDVTVYDIKWLSMWCIRFTANFGEVFIPTDLNVPPYVGDITSPPQELGNCEELNDDFQVSWELQSGNLDLQLAGRVADGDYMAFGISGCTDRTCMVGSDVTVAWFDIDTPRAVDYTLGAYSQCSGTSGVCPDDRVGGTDDNFDVTGTRINGITRIKYSRPINTGDTADKVIDPAQNMFISWAIGPINPSGLAAKHHTRAQGSVQLLFGRSPSYLCSMIDRDRGTPAPVTPWPANVINDDVTNFTVRIGPTGGRRGYEAITGQPGWGITWWINDLLIPELTLTRGQNYSFIVEGGDDPSQPARYHPFYITDDPIGGFVQKTAAEKQQVGVFAGVDDAGLPTAAGRYCEYTSPGGDTSETSETFAEYYRTLNLTCESGQSARLSWTPDHNTPDLVYYQCYTHQYLGWKINVVDADSDPCTPNPCQRQGACTVTGPTTFTCTCNHGYSGDVCQYACEDYFSSSEASRYAVYDNRCYWFSPTDYRRSRKYMRARVDCVARSRGRGATLALIKDADTQAFVEQYLGTIVSGPRRDYWIGLDDRARERHFEWNDGTALGYQNWARSRRRHRGKDCAGVMPSGKWDLYRCRQRKAYICQMPRVW